MSVLVIGSNSFSGSNFIDFLIKKSKKKIIGISRSNQLNNVFLSYKSNITNNFYFYKLDINKQLTELKNLIEKHKINYIVNFAAQGMVAESWGSPLDWYQTNFISTVKMYEEFMKFKSIKKIIQFSTPEVYGSTKNLIKENWNFNPSTPYALSRQSIDLHLKMYAENYSLPVTFTRAANVYGPGQQLYRIIPATIFRPLINEKIFIHGDGLSKRSFIHINDVSRALYKILLDKENIGETFHISTNKWITIKKLIEEILKISGYDFNQSTSYINERVGKDHSYKLNSYKLRVKYEWQDEISLKDGLADTVKWVKNNLNMLKKVSTEYTHKK